MKLSTIFDKMPKMPKTFGQVKVLAKKHAPEAMVIVGAGIVVASAVIACKNTVEASDVLSEADDAIKTINYGREIAGDDDDFDDRKARRKVYRHVTKQMIRLYGPSVAGAAIGFGLIFGSHKIIKDRNTALTLAYSNLLANYTAYRDRVRDELGDDREFALYTGAEKRDIVVEDEDGKQKKIKNADVVHDDGSGHSIYARIFDEGCSNWSRNPVANLDFLRRQQNFANDKLRCEGVLFLNDVYQMLGLPRTPAGQIVGWVWDPNNDKHVGDNYVDFGIYDNLYRDQAKRDFINAAEPCIWLDFNVDGVVYDLL